MGSYLPILSDPLDSFPEPFLSRPKIIPVPLSRRSCDWLVLEAVAEVIEHGEFVPAHNVPIRIHQDPTPYVRESILEHLADRRVLCGFGTLPCKVQYLQDG
jgi:hypothetical protein